jgi:acetyltransferase
MWRYSENLRSLYETPMLATDQRSGREQVVEMITTARQTGHTLLDEVASKDLLAAYGIPTVETRFAESEDAAVASADALSYPVVLKVCSPMITHKSDIGGVQLHLADAAAVRRAFRQIKTAVHDAVGADQFRGVTVQPMVLDTGYELLLGSSIDEQFGPVLLFGAGGRLVEVFQDHALGLPPLTTTLARRIMEQTRIWAALTGVRGRSSVDVAALEQLLVRFSQLVVEQPRIKEIDINPLLVTSERLLALDARVMLHGPEVDQEHLPQPAIRPYPTQYIASWTLKDGTPVTIRPIRPEDEPLMVQFHATLSERSVHMRYFMPLALSMRTAHERLTRLCFIDYNRQMALVVERTDPQSGEQSIIAVGRLIKLPNKIEAEFAILISDHYHGHGLGTELLRRLVQVGRDERLSKIVAEILPENRGMQRVAEKLGFQLRRIFSAQVVMAEINL